MLTGERQACFSNISWLTGRPRLVGLFGQRTFCGAAVALLCSVPCRGADPETATFTVDYVAHEGCPSSEAFERQVQLRTARARVIRGHDAMRAFQIVIERIGDSSRGTLRSGTPDRLTAERSIDAPLCEEVVTALALIVALTLDPEASTAPLPSDGSLPPVDAPASRSRLEPAQVPAVSKAPARAAERVPPPPPMAWRWTFGAGVGLEAVSGVAPGWLPALRVAVGVEARVAPPFSPAIELSVARGTRSLTHRGVPVSFTWSTARVELCPLTFEADRVLRFRGCAFFDAGELRGEAGAAPGIRAAQDSRPWYAPGGLARVMWVAVPPLTLQVHAGASMPLVRDRFVFSAENATSLDTIHDVPAVVAQGAVMLGLTFR